MRTIIALASRGVEGAVIWALRNATSAAVGTSEQPIALLAPAIQLVKYTSVFAENVTTRVNRLAC